MESSIFAIRLNELLQQKKIKQVDLVRLAEEKGIKLGKSHISQYVSGKTVPRREILQFLAGVLDVEPDWLLVYKITESVLVLTLYRTGTHSDLFK